MGILDRRRRNTVIHEEIIMNKYTVLEQQINYLLTENTGINMMDSGRSCLDNVMEMIT